MSSCQIISWQNKINVEFNRIEDCIVLGPTNSIEIEDDIIHLKNR